MPSTVITTDPNRCDAIWAKPQPYRCSDNSVTTSAEKVENVVKAPQNPVMMKSRASAGTVACSEKYSIASPMTYPPTRFAMSVPKGKLGDPSFNWFPSHQRNHAPSTAPTATERRG